MTIKDCEIETAFRYPPRDEEDGFQRGASAIDILTIKIKLPGGLATYTIDLPNGMKKSIESAESLRVNSGA